MDLTQSDHSEFERGIQNLWTSRALVLSFLLGALLLRAAALGPMSTTMLHYDEAFNAVDSLSLLRDFRLTPFLPGNFGRESGWAYWLMPFLAFLGRGVFALRVAAVLTGFLTVAAVYRLGVELFPRRNSECVATWSVGSLAVLYWHVHLSHLALRANLYLLVGTMATVFLISAHRCNRLRLWAVGGGLLGAMAYTYFASLCWIGYVVFLLGGSLVLDRTRRRGVLLALMCAAVVVTPVVVYGALHPEHVVERPSTVSALGVGALLSNVEAWGIALFDTGDPNALFNLPERPILDSLLGLMAISGLVGLVVVRRWRISGLLTLGLAAATVVPSLLSNFAPHFLRGYGLVIPLALVLGVGGAAIASLLVRWGWRTESWVLPMLLLVAVGVVTARDFHSQWLTHPETFTAMEVHINRAANLLRDVVPVDASVYFSPFTPGHPVVTLRGQDLAPRPVSAFDSHECWVVPDGDAAYVSLTLYEPSFASKLARWADVELLYEDVTDVAPRPRYSVFLASPVDLAPTVPTARFSDQFEVQLLNSLVTEVKAGATITVALGVRALRTPEIAPSVFLHLYTIPTPYDGGEMLAQADSQLCTSYPAHLWRPEEMVIQTFRLVVPDDAAEGSYRIGMGIYPFPAGARLPVVSPSDSVHDYVALGEVTVVP